ncbi:MAG: 4-hydroxy-tetrahydrodipicolinate reductase [bacterium]
MLYIGVNGATGKMGSLICKRILFESDMSLTDAFENPENQYLNCDLGTSIGIEEWKINILPLDNSKQYKTKVLIDFSSKEGFSSALNFCISSSTPLVSGTTGLSDAQIKQLKEASKSIPILYSANMSTGINSLLILLDSLKQILCDKERDIEIIEYHHNQKKDSPSGTALAIAERISEISKRKINSSDKISFPRGSEIRIHSLRIGSVPGYHKIIISGNGETIELSHSADSRDTFVTGAIKAARFIAKKNRGLYTMIDALKEK